VTYMDTAGQEKFRVQANAYLRGAFGVLLVYDICDKPSFEHLEDWLTLIRDNGSSDMIIMVLGNKSDKKHERLVNIKEAEQFCETNKLRADIGGETQLMHREAYTVFRHHSCMKIHRQESIVQISEDCSLSLTSR